MYYDSLLSTSNTLNIPKISKMIKAPKNKFIIKAWREIDTTGNGLSEAKEVLQFYNFTYINNKM